jgi:hypothetical protein
MKTNEMIKKIPVSPTVPLSVAFATPISAINVIMPKIQYHAIDILYTIHP